jgi:hypothetical protein
LQVIRVLDVYAFMIEASTVHSQRNASNGSTFAARRTGTQHARSPTP